MARLKLLGHLVADDAGKENPNLQSLNYSRNMYNKKHEQDRER